MCAFEVFGGEFEWNRRVVVVCVAVLDVRIKRPMLAVVFARQ